jgi:hypothetical protein
VVLQLLSSPRTLRLPTLACPPVAPPPLQATRLAEGATRAAVVGLRWRRRAASPATSSAELEQQQNRRKERSETQDKGADVTALQGRGKGIFRSGPADFRSAFASAGRTYFSAERQARDLLQLPCVPEPSRVGPRHHRRYFFPFLPFFFFLFCDRCACLAAEASSAASRENNSAVRCGCS